MKFNIGDRVKFLNDVGQGVIVGIKDKNTYNVENDDEFVVPVNKSELILIEEKNNFANHNNKINKPEKDNKTEQEENIEEINFNETELNINESKDFNLYLALVPQDNNDILSSNLDAFFINDSSFFAIVVVKAQRNKQYHLLKTIIVEPDTKIKIFDIYRQKLNDYSKLFVQVILYNKISNYHIRTFDKKISIKANKLYSLNSYKENDYTDENAILFSIDKIDEPEIKKANNVQKLLNQKIKSDIKSNKSNSIKKQKKSDKIEVDLHIGELLDDYSSLTNFEILSIQIAEFKKQLEKAILDKDIKKIIFIHGVGEGKLKFELRKILDKDYSRYEYQDASYEQYGFGATMVLLR